MKPPLVILIAIMVFILGFLVVYSQQHDMNPNAQTQVAAGGYGSGSTHTSGGYGAAPAAAAGGYGAAPAAAAGGYGAAPASAPAPAAAGGYGAPAPKPNAQAPATGGYKYNFFGCS